MTSNDKPDYATPPGHEIIRRALKMDISPTQAARRMHMSDKRFRDIVYRHVNITDTDARSISRVLGGSVCYWLHLDSTYQKAHNND